MTLGLKHIGEDKKQSFFFFFNVWARSMKAKEQILIGFYKLTFVAFVTI